ncbi:MAG TPA: aldo/keto reductase [Gemmataceae bacterium]|nr:aldo/keto reductase [Gemmataceae bacterium]
MADDPKVSRRAFLGAGVAGTALLLGNEVPVWAGAPNRLPQRTLGRTGVNVPILGLGTVALGNLGDEKQAVALLNRALNLGVTFIDTAPGSTRIALLTGYGRAQRYLHGVLRERRKEVFLVTKCLETDGERTLTLLRANLKELGVERVDLTYTHSIGHAVYDFDQLVGDKGPMAALERAKRDGLTRFVGITGHNRPEKFARVLARRSIDVMMNAVNIVDRHTYAFEDVVWPAARKQKVALVAMKVFGGGIKTCRMPEDVRRASFRFAQSVPGVALTVIGMGTRKELEQNVEWARTFKPMTVEEANELKKRTVALAKEWGVHLDRLDAKGERSRPLVNT